VPEWAGYLDEFKKYPGKTLAIKTH